MNLMQAYRTANERKTASLAEPRELAATDPLFPVLADRLGLPETQPAESATAEVHRKELLEQFRAAGKINRRNGPRVAITHALLTISADGSIGIVATDSEMTLTQRDVDGVSALVDPHKAVSLMAKLKADCITLKLSVPAVDWREKLSDATANDVCHSVTGSEGTTLTFDPIKARQFVNNRRENPTFSVVAGSAEFSIPAVGNWHAIEFDPFEPFATATLPAAEFRRALEQTEYACDVESTRYALGGILLELETAKLKLAATDSRRLATFDVAAETADYRPEPGIDPKYNRPAERQPAACVIPAGAARMALSMIPKRTDELVTVRIGETRVSFTYDGLWKIDSRTVDGRFPRYRDVIPAPDRFGHVVGFATADFREALETVSLCGSDSSRCCDFSADVNGEHLTLTMKSEENGKATVDVACETAVDVSRVSCITFDPKYVLEYVKHVSADVVHLAMIDAESPGILFAECHAQYVLMPLSRDR